MLNKYRIEYLKYGIFKFFEVLLSLIIVRFLTKNYDEENIANYFLFLSILDFLRLLFLGEDSNIRNTGINKVSATVILSTGLFWSVITFWANLFINFIPESLTILSIFPFLISLLILIESAFYIELKSYGTSLIMILQKFGFLALLIVGKTQVLVSIFLSFMMIPLFFVRKLPIIYFGRISQEDIKGYIHQSFPFLLLAGSVFILKGTDIWIIKFLLSDFDVNLYSYLLRYFGIFLIFNAMISAPLWNRLKSKPGSRRALFKEFNVLSVILLIILIGQYFFAKDLIELIFGVSLNLSKADLFTWMFFVLVSNRTAWTNQNLNSLGKARFQSKVNLIMVICNIPLSVLLVMYFGYKGVIIATNILMLITWIIKSRKLSEIILLEDKVVV